MPFQNLPRTDTGPKRINESSFLFLDPSARPEVARVRAHIMEALSRYPASDCEELIARVRSGRETDFKSATFELFLHDCLIRLGYEVSCHPDPCTGSTKRPDFFASDSAGNEFFLEAVLASEDDGSSPAAEAMKEDTLARLDALPHEAFVLDISSEGDPISQPSSNELIRCVSTWLDTLAPNVLRKCFADQGLEGMPMLNWRHEGWKLTIRAIPISEERRGKFSRLIGTYGSGAQFVNMWEPLRNAVKKKASRYGELAKPYVIAVNAGVCHLDEIDEVQALYGEEFYSVKMIDGQRIVELDHHHNGAWNGPHGPQNRRVSAVWFFNELTPYSLARSKSTLYVNPWANLAPPLLLQGIPTKKFEGNELISIPGTDLAALFGIDSTWPK